MHYLCENISIEIQTAMFYYDGYLTTIISYCDVGIQIKRRVRIVTSPLFETFRKITIIIEHFITSIEIALHVTINIRMK